MFTQQRQRVIHPEAMLKMVSNVYNLRLQKQTDYVKENIYRSMPFTQVRTDLNEDSLLLFRHKVMENYEETIDYDTVILYSFTP